MNKQLNANDIRNAKAVYLYNNSVLFVVDHDDNAYGLNEHGKEWYYKDNFWDYFESTTMLSYLSSITKDEAVYIFEKRIHQTHE